MSTAQERALLVFDFDHTVVEENTDVEVMSLWDEAKAGGKTLKDVVRPYSAEHSWTTYMNDVMEALHDHGVTREHIEERMCRLRLTPGMAELFKAANETGVCDIVIASASNTFFIETILKHHELAHTVAAVYTHPAEFASDGRLVVKPFADNKTCANCEADMCKSDIVREFTASRPDVVYKKVSYAGDGRNDFCPMQSLSSPEHHLALVREGFSLERFLARSQVERDAGKEVAGIEAQQHFWKTANDIRPLIESMWASLLAQPSSL